MVQQGDCERLDLHQTALRAQPVYLADAKRPGAKNVQAKAMAEAPRAARARSRDVGSSISIALAGSGGSGVMTAGTLLLDAAAKAGLYGIMVRTSGPQIRGGEAAALVRLASAPLESLGDKFDLLLAIDWQNV